MTDVIVTTPIKNRELAAQEAQGCIDKRKGFYFRTFANRPKHLAPGSRIFYVEHPFVVGFGTVSEIRHGKMVCGTSGHDWGNGYHAIIPAKSWKWIKPIAMSGFQGWRYSQLQPKKIKVIGGWLDPKPTPPPVAPRVALRLQSGKVPLLTDNGTSLLLPRELYEEYQVLDLRKVGLKIEHCEAWFKVILPKGWTTDPSPLNPELHVHILDCSRRTRALIYNDPQIKAHNSGFASNKVLVHQRYCYEFRLQDDGKSISIVAGARKGRRVKELYVSPAVPLPTPDEQRLPGCRFSTSKALDSMIKEAHKRLRKETTFWWD